MKTTEEIEQALMTDKLPSSAVKSRDQAGRSFSYVDGHYVFTRMNEVFGTLGWSYRIHELKMVHDGESPSKDGKRVNATVSYMATVAVDIGNQCIETIDVGHGHGIGADRGLQHESAAKEAVTDAVKRACRRLGASLGLALYDKDQRDVDHGPALEHGRKAGTPMSEYNADQIAKYLEAYRGEASLKHIKECNEYITNNSKEK